MNKFDCFECLDCAGDGILIIEHPPGEFNQEECPNCNNGRVDHKAHMVQEASWLELDKLMSQAKL